MNVKDVHKYIDWYFPFFTATDFDNVGVLVGGMDAEVKRAVVALDCTKATVEYAVSVGAQLIVTHHPVIFDPLKSIKDDTVVYQCIKNGIAVISAHTNLDVGRNGINDKLCERIGLERIAGLYIDGMHIRTGWLKEPMSAKALAEHCKEKLSAAVKFVDGGKPISRVAVCSGGGGSMLDDVLKSDVDAYITGDIKHSQFIAAFNRDFTLIDCGHFDTEDIIVEPLTELLKKQLPEIEFFEYHGTEIQRV